MQTRILEECTSLITNQQVCLGLLADLVISKFSPSFFNQ
jgi:hypothetical protein